jgi:hypothetical protein
MMSGIVFLLSGETALAALLAVLAVHFLLVYRRFRLLVRLGAVEVSNTVNRTVKSETVDLDRAFLAIRYEDFADAIGLDLSADAFLVHGVFLPDREEIASPLSQMVTG